MPTSSGASQASMAVVRDGQKELGASGLVSAELLYYLSRQITGHSDGGAASSLPGIPRPNRSQPVGSLLLASPLWGGGGRTSLALAFGLGPGSLSLGLTTRTHPAGTFCGFSCSR